MNIIQKYNMFYNKYKHMLEHELESYVQHLYYNKRLKLKEISEDLGCSQATASRFLKKFNVKTGLHRTRIDPTKYGFGNLTHMILTMSECLKAGMNKKQLAINMKCSRATVIRICKKFNLQ